MKNEIKIEKRNKDRKKDRKKERKKERKWKKERERESRNFNECVAAFKLEQKKKKLKNCNSIFLFQFQESLNNGKYNILKKIYSVLYQKKVFI